MVELVGTESALAILEEKNILLLNRSDTLQDRFDIICEAFNGDRKKSVAKLKARPRILTFSVSILQKLPAASITEE
jgi:hypothetical protein